MASVVQLPRSPGPPSLPPPSPLPHLPKTNLKRNLYCQRAKSVSLERTHQVFEECPSRDVVSWTSSIATHCRNGHLHKATSTFSRMLSAGVLPNPITLVTLLSACADNPLESLQLGFSIHGLVLKCFPVDAKHDVFLGTSLVDMYAKCGCVDLARQAFDQIAGRNSVTWNTMIHGYMRGGEVDEAVSLFSRMPRGDRVSWTAVIDGFVRNGLHHEALLCFQEMQHDGVEADYVTVITVVSACADMGALRQGMWLHRFAQKKCLLRHVRLSNALIDMYFRCGCVKFAQQLFEHMRDRTHVSWNSMIVGLAMNGSPQDALEHFAMMQEQGFEPNAVSFTGVLTACSHGGLVEEGLRYFDVMMRVYGISPRVEHYGCLVDLLSRAGCLGDAMEVVESMPMRPNEVVLGSLLAACSVHGDVQLGEKLMGYLVELEPECDSNYVLLSNIYAAMGKWENVGKVRNAMKSLGITKKPGFSAIEIDGNMHEFVAGDKSHCHSEEFNKILNLLGQEMKLCGYVSQATLDLPSD